MDFAVEFLLKSFNGNMQDGIQKICRYLKVNEENEIPVIDFTLHLKAGDVVVKVVAGKFKTAGLIRVLGDASSHVAGMEISALTMPIIEARTFFYTAKLQKNVKEFFGDVFCQEVLDDIDTPHTLRDLLQNVDFWITVRVAKIGLIGKLFDMLLYWKQNPDHQHQELYLTEPFVLEAMQIARDLHARGTIPVLHELLQ